MALQIWLPLTNANRIQNHGLLGDLTITTTPSIISGGKLGGTLNGGGYKMSTDQTKMCLNNKEFSCAFWVKVTSSAERKLFFGNDYPRQFSIFNYPTINDLHLSWANSAGTNVFSTVDSGVFPTNVWTHCCVTYNNPTVTVYINGNVLRTYSYTCDLTDFAKETQVIHTATGRYLNDFRVYNHCLSPKEVKEISKGLVLHYPMDNCNIEANNLLNNASSYREGTPYKCTTTSKDGYFHTNMYYNNDSLAGKTVTFSVSTNKQIAPSHGGSSSTHDKVCLWFYINTSAYNGSSSAYSNAICLTNSSNNFKSLGNNRYSWTYTIPSGIKGLMIRTNLYSNDGSTVSANFWDFQLEFGSVASPFSTNKWTSNTIYDCSGFGNNGTITSSSAPILDNDSPRYSNSFKFAGSQYINAGQGGKITDSFSICWWGHMDNWSSYGRAASCTESGGWNFESNGTGMEWNVFTNGQYYDASDSTALSSLTGWHHWVGTYDKNSLKIYRDGELRGTNTFSANTAIGYNSTNSIIIGGEATASSASAPWFVGKLSDFRIYGTALSAEDVKELYNTSAMVCDNGTVMAYSLEE